MTIYKIVIKLPFGEIKHHISLIVDKVESRLMMNFSHQISKFFAYLCDI